MARGRRTRKPNLGPGGRTSGPRNIRKRRRYNAPQPLKPKSGIGRRPRIRGGRKGKRIVKGTYQWDPINSTWYCWCPSCGPDCSCQCFEVSESDPSIAGGASNISPGPGNQNSITAQGRAGLKNCGVPDHDLYLIVQCGDWQVCVDDCERPPGGTCYDLAEGQCY